MGFIDLTMRNVESYRSGRRLSGKEVEKKKVKGTQVLFWFCYPKSDSKELNPNMSMFVILGLRVFFCPVMLHSKHTKFLWHVCFIGKY